MIPHTTCDLKKAKFYLILLNQGNDEVLQDRNDLDDVIKDTLAEHGNSGSVAQLVFRQVCGLIFLDILKLNQCTWDVTVLGEFEHPPK